MVVRVGLAWEIGSQIINLGMGWDTFMTIAWVEWYH